MQTILENETQARAPSPLQAIEVQRNINAAQLNGHCALTGHDETGPIYHIRGERLPEHWIAYITDYGSGDITGETIPFGEHHRERFAGLRDGEFPVIVETPLDVASYAFDPKAKSFRLVDWSAP